MDIKDRMINYEPLFNQWLFDELLEIHDQEALIKVKPQGIETEKEAYIKVITIYNQNDNLEELEQRMMQIKTGLGLDNINQTEFLDYEQYLIENNQGMIIGMDLCLLLENDDYQITDIDKLNGHLLYEEGLKLFDRRQYQQALKYFQKGEELENSDCICIIGYLYERGLALKQDYFQARKYYQRSSNLGNVVASCNLAYLYEHGLGGIKDYQKAFELYQYGAKAGFARAICNLGYCYYYCFAPCFRAGTRKRQCGWIRIS